jgi:hypothetical protein
MTPTSDGATPHDHPGHLEGPAPLAQWLGLLLAPAAFFVHLQTAYVLMLWACARGSGTLWIHVAGILAVVLGALGLWAAWLTWTRASGEEPGEGGGPVPRTRLLGAAGLGVSALMVLLIASQWLAVFLVPMCQ